jgi:putative ABC transport system ATP-binding protein
LSVLHIKRLAVKNPSFLLSNPPAGGLHLIWRIPHGAGKIKLIGGTVMPIVLEATQLKKQYTLGGEEIHALQGVEFRVQKGEFVAIMGPSGSGKSTLLHLLGGLDRPTEGEIHLAGKRLSVMDENQITLLRRHNVGFVFQFFNLIPTLSAEENILLPLIIDGKDTRRFADRLDRLLRLVGLTLRRNHKPDQLSGGEQQRVALARAMITQPAIVLADEPTGNLDSKTGSDIMEMLRRSCDELNQTIVMVSHDPRAAAYADRVVFIRDGLIVAQLELKGKGFEASLHEIIAAIEQYQI